MTDPGLGKFDFLRNNIYHFYMSFGLTHDAILVMKELEQRRRRLNSQINNLRSYDKWRLIKGQTLKSGVSYYSAVYPGIGRKKYLGNDRHPDVVNVKRLRYAKEAAAVCYNNIRLLEKLIESYVDTDYQTINSRLPITYRTELSNESGERFRINMPIEAIKWIGKKEKEKAKYPPYKPEQLKHPAMDGTLMRSKSEVIIANILLLAGIPFVYEVPIFIDGKMVLPDFTILSLIDLKTEIIIEHQGMVFVEEYAEKYIRSLKLYLQQSYWIPNKNLFFTFDDAKETLDTQQVTDILRKHIYPEL